MTFERTENKTSDRDPERGTATLTAVMIMGLLALFTAASLSRVTTEAMVMGNDYSHTQAFYASQASLELMSRNFNKIFDVQLRPTAADLVKIENGKPGIDGFNFDQRVVQMASSSSHPIEDGPFSGLVSLRTPWRLQAVATYANGAQVQLTRTFYNHQIPIFQFGIFYNDDMELYPGPNFNFGGRVHSNGHLFLMSGNNLYFRSRVTAVGEIVRDISRSGKSLTDGNWLGKVWVADSSNVFRELKLAKASVVGGPDTVPNNPNMPDGAFNTNWSQDLKLFNGNLLARQPVLRLPLQIGTDEDPIELVKRGKPSDNALLRDSRFFNNPGIRISLSDSQARLPGGSGGVRLDGVYDGVQGYLPQTMNGGLYQATRFNPHRVYTATSYDGSPRETWIKVELVTRDAATLTPQAVDITADILSLGFTESAAQLGFSSNPAPSTSNPQDDKGADNRAIIKLQRYTVPGPPIKVAAGNVNNSNLPTSGSPAPAVFTSAIDARDNAGRNAYSYENSSGGFSFVATSESVFDTATSQYRWQPRNAANSGAEATPAGILDNSSNKATPYEAEATVGGTRYRVVPFPIKLYDTREGLYNEDLPATGTPSWASRYTGTNSSRVPVAGVMSVVDIDMFNLGRFLSGMWDGQFPANANLSGGSLSSDDLQDNGGAGWIVYVSDRRGDADDDGEYDMEDIYGPNDGVLQPGEDTNHNGVLDRDTTWESRRYFGQTELSPSTGSFVDVSSIETDVAAVNARSDGGQGLAVYSDRYFRRAVRIINGERLSGAVTLNGNTATLPGTLNKGFTVSSENGVYTLGNLNATGITAVGDPSQPDQYTGPEVPFAVISDAITVLSRNWADGKSFRNPFRTGTRSATETSVRTALLMGDAISSQTQTGVPSAGGKDENLNGGVHNFPRFLENWPARLNYCGSLINLFTSRNNNGQFKCCQTNVYGAPTRNWVFNTAFLDINRLPPGTPFFQYIQMTGFRQTVRQVR